MTSCGSRGPAYKVCMKFENMPDNKKSPEVYHRVENCGKIFSRLSIVIPENLKRVAQAVHGDLSDCLIYISKAGEEKIPETKLEYLEKSERILYYLYSRIDYLLMTKSISIGQANEFVSELNEAHTQTLKWLRAVRRDIPHTS